MTETIIEPRLAKKYMVLIHGELTTGFCTSIDYINKTVTLYFPKIPNNEISYASQINWQDLKPLK